MDILYSMISSSSLPSIKYCGDSTRNESLTEYAYFIFCNCLPTPTDRRQEGSIKLLRKKFPELYMRVSHDLSACQIKRVPNTTTIRKQEFSMCDLETALEQYCARNGHDCLPYTAAASAIAAHLHSTQAAVARSLEAESKGGEVVVLCGEMEKLGGQMNKAIELTNQRPELAPEEVPVSASNSQTESFLIRTEASGSSEELLDIPLDTSRLKEMRSVPQKSKVACFASSVVSYDADLSSETDTFHSTPLHDRKKVKQTDSKKHAAYKKQTGTNTGTKITHQVVGPDCHGPDRIFKVVMLGNSGVGKSSLVSALVLGNARYAIATIGVDMVVKTFVVQGMKVSLQIWDTAGEERFHCMAPSYIRKADAVILVYDISDHSSFVDIPMYWLPFIRRYMTGESVSLVLLGNKIDKYSQRVITGEDGCVLSRDASMVFREVSSLDCDTVCGVYHSLAQSLVARENDELDKFSQLTVTIRRAQNALDSSPKHGSCYC